MKAIKHFQTITKHKILVGQLCFKLHLYRQGLCHDLSKYSFTEFKTGVLYYQGTSSPNGAERKLKGYSEAWLHHKGRNKHHWEYWVDFTRNGTTAAKMPYRYVLEMFCDRIAASMVYRGKDYDDSYPLAYYESGKHSYIMNSETRALLEYLLVELKDQGLEKTFKMINTKKGYEDYHLEDGL
ncbi:catalase [Sharpea azabuensis]|jgi:hypothetical protein|uniref:Catalase n=1 Tax=Sharpea porci TaxID=2652286 RepID=A0A844FQW2_9FIRM|nr:DUF5662 family protein [Sharpea porci]MDD6711554.1 DUF5662 family protein [Sharpea porci]MDY5279699.1 DUF5662 family protein [Sharpea porci]MST88035.1 catalase [Sharpea porci]